jgi:hypothetical protein
LLLAEEEKQVQWLIQDRTPDQLKMSYALWTRQAVSELIEARFAIRLAVRNTGKYLKRWGFTPQKPLKKAYEQSPAAVSKWFGEAYPGIAQRAKAEKAEVQWGDETGLRSDDVRGRGYAPKGQTPVVRANANESSESKCDFYRDQQRADALEGLFRRPECKDSGSFSRAVDTRAAEENLPDPR